MCVKILLPVMKHEKPDGFVATDIYKEKFALKKSEAQDCFMHLVS